MKSQVSGNLVKIGAKKDALFTKPRKVSEPLNFGLLAQIDECTEFTRIVVATTIKFWENMVDYYSRATPIKVVIQLC